VWAIKRCPQPASPCSGCRADVGDRPSTLRVAPGALRERLTFRRCRVDRPLDGGLARRPELCVKFQNGTTQNRRRRCTVERPSEAATGSSRRTSTGFAGTRLAARSRSGSLASRPGEAGWNPADARIRRTSCRSLFDPIEGDAPGEGTFPDSRAGTPAIAEAYLAVSVEPHALPGIVARSKGSSTAGRCAMTSPWNPTTEILFLENRIGQFISAESFRGEVPNPRILRACRCFTALPRKMRKNRSGGARSQPRGAVFTVLFSGHAEAVPS
jgi:hypothetical protein